MYTSEFSKHWNENNGFTMEEAIRKKEKVDEAHRVYTAASQWKPAEIIPDPSKKNGYKVVICTKV